VVELITFNEAIADAGRYTRRHLLLGNGFSIACLPKVFHYGSLFNEAKFDGHPNLPKVFHALGTQDFEVAIHSLESGAKLFPIYAASHATATAQMLADAAALKEILVTTIAQNHPNFPAEILDDKLEACRRFLSHFLGHPQGGQVFTLNYDLLLYWTLMHDDKPSGSRINLITSDGFGNDETDPNAEYVVWQGETGSHSARVHFLHGALHLFDAGSEIQKFTWVRTNERLVHQARTAINDNKFPIFVSEGTSGQKKAKIRHNAYLYQGFKHMTANAVIGTHCFFLHGHSLAPNDDHILRRLGKGHFKKLYVSLFGDPDAPHNKEIIARANGLARMREDHYPLEISFYDAVSAQIWG
jgi:hypothetical protein